MAGESEFYESLYKSLVKTQIRRGQDLEDAQDLAQQAILQVLADRDKHPNKYPDNDAIKLTAHTTARNLLATLANRKKMFSRRHIPIADESRFKHASNQSAEDVFFTKHLNDNISTSLEEVPPDMRDTIQRIASGESITDIAKDKKIKRGNIGQTISKARQKIKRKLRGLD